MQKRRILMLCLCSLLCLSLLLSVFGVLNKEEKILEKKVLAQETGADSADVVKKGGSVYVAKNTQYFMKGGTIRNTHNVYGGAIYVENGATLTLQGTTIENCRAKYGGAIYVENGATCNIEGGVITDCNAEYSPAIYVEEGGILNISDEAQLLDNVYRDWLDVVDLISEDTIRVGSESEYIEMHYIDMGSYPQTYVGNEMNLILEDWYQSQSPEQVENYNLRDYNWQSYKYSDGNIYVRGKAKRVSTEDVWGVYSTGDEVFATGTIVWFKVEPIRWVVLNYNEVMNRGENLKVMSLYAIASGIGYGFNTIGYIKGIEWHNSDARKWLNGEFFNVAFTEIEKDVIAKSPLKNKIRDAEDYSITTQGKSSADHIYLPEKDDIINSDKAIFKKWQQAVTAPSDFILSNSAGFYKSLSTSLTTGAVAILLRDGVSNGKSLVWWSSSYGDESVSAKYVGLRPMMEFII